MLKTFSFLSLTENSSSTELWGMCNIIYSCPAKLGIFSFFENTVDPDQLTKPSDQDPHYFLLRLKIHAYNWNAAGYWNTLG